MMRGFAVSLAPPSPLVREAANKVRRSVLPLRPHGAADHLP